MLVKRFPRLLKLLALVAVLFLAVFYFTSSNERWPGSWLQRAQWPNSEAVYSKNDSLVVAGPAATIVRSSNPVDAVIFPTSLSSSTSDDWVVFTTSPSSSLSSTPAPSPTEYVVEPGNSMRPTVSNVIQDHEYQFDSPAPAPSPAEDVNKPGNSTHSIISGPMHDPEYQIDLSRHREVFSISTPERTYFGIEWGDNKTYNPNILPHPTKHGQYLVVAQLEQDIFDHNENFYVMACIANFINETLGCSEPPMTLPIAHTTTDTLCRDATHSGPHDPRVFYGPGGPFISYGSHSANSCQGVWIQDLRHLVPEFGISTVVLFDQPTDVQRPPPYRETEKNYFLFWDSDNNMYVHHDLSPDRVFTPLYANGSVGPDLAPEARAVDEPCMRRHMPQQGLRNGSGQGLEYEEIHQSTNSLAITLCRRSDPECHPNNDNTFNMVIFHHKSYYAQHPEYFPYVMLFQQTAPFAIHALSTKAIWIHGRTGLTQATDSRYWRGRYDLPTDQSEMFFVVSMSWKTPRQRYHGYVDDEMFLAFGIEDSRSAGIDIVAGDLLQDLGYCSNVGDG